ncbi:PREDICTED: uncharacterized protein LOC104814856 [Tarenaya hassleriana]|uniref:uncharacterized protein LOC104814856 n=1 Tax=Tarenaya hassleriana TaxID=28532 RepID=UPI00053C26F9|nr:PREDICTED: uncharacterized protein LOC104814856 [Tarenaya hassleriana]
MATDKSNVKLSRFDPEFSHSSGETMSSDEGELLQRKISAANPESEEEDDEDDVFDDDADSGAGSDDFDLLELAETGAEFCQVKNMTCSIPFELYDLPGLEDILSVEVWNECLTEGERLSLTKYLPDMDQLTFMHTLKELLEGCDFHFGSPIKKLFGMFTGGKCEPRNALYLEGRNLFLRTKHYHMLRKYHNDLVVNLCQIRDAWSNCKGYSVDEKLRVMNIMKSQKNLMYEKMEKFEADSSEKEEPFDVQWRRKVKDGKSTRKKLNRHSAYGVETDFERPSQMALGQDRYGRPNAKGLSKTASSKIHSWKESIRQFTRAYNGLDVKYGSGLAFGSDDRMPVGDDDDDDVDDDPLFGMGSRHDRNKAATKKSGFSRLGKKHNFLRDRESGSKHFMPPPYADSIQPSAFVDQRKRLRLNGQSLQPLLMGNLADHHGDLYRHGNIHGDGFSVNPTFISDVRNGKSKKRKSESQSPDISLKTCRDSVQQMNERFLNSDFGENPELEKIRVNVIPNGRLGGAAYTYTDSRMFTRNGDTESDSSEEYDDKEERNPLTWNKSAFSAAGMNSSQSQVPEAGRYGKRGKVGKKDMPEKERVLNGRGKVKDGDNGKEYVTANKSSQIREELTDRMQIPPAKPDLADRKRKGSDETDGSFEIGALEHCSSVSRKRKTRGIFTGRGGKDDNGDLQFDLQLPIDEFTSSKRKGKKKTWADAGSPMMETSETPKVAIETEVGTKPQQKKPFVLITPTSHTGFSFSTIHLLSAVRVAMISPPPDEDSLDNGRPRPDQNGGHEAGENRISVSKDMDSNGKGDFPPLTVQEIVSRVRSNPGDPCILETQEPIQDLIRGVLKIFSSKTSPLGAKGWKPLVLYDKPAKSWNWIGPFPHATSDHETSEEVTSPEAWGLPHKMLVKLVDCFANWLKNGQETLQQIGSLPGPPLSLMQCNLDEKERFKDLRAQKSLSTINPSSEEARTYFRKEEFLRYSIPDRAFAYTAADGKKSIVAPLRRGGGKPTSKARDHFMLKRDRPPHVTILCLVRDSAARLPGSIGTRADVCTLIRDSQYIVEDVTDGQVNQVVSGALDRLHYERDPCVQFDSDRKLWVYLHREREEEDFEDDGTSSTKKWKRPKKEEEEEEEEAAEQPDQGAVTEVAAMDEDKGAEVLRNETGQDAAENVSFQTSNPVEDNNTFLCQENSADDGFD